MFLSFQLQISFNVNINPLDKQNIFHKMEKLKLVAHFVKLPK